MKMCGQHWEDLKRELADRGLEAFIADGGADVAAKLEAERARDQFDPLLSATLAIYSNAISAGGLRLLSRDDDGQLCPICELVAGCECRRGPDCSFQRWIAGAANDELMRARLLGLLPMPASA